MAIAMIHGAVPMTGSGQAAGYTRKNIFKEVYIYTNVMKGSTHADNHFRGRTTTNVCT